MGFVEQVVGYAKEKAARGEIFPVFFFGEAALLYEKEDRLQEAALRLENRPLLERDVFTRGAPGEAPSAAEEEGEAMMEVGVFELVAAFRRIVAGFDRPEELEIDAEKMSLADRINEIMEMLSEKQQMTFVELIGDRTDRRRIIYTFLAILELMKLRMIRAYQSGPFGAIRLFLAVEG